MKETAVILLNYMSWEDTLAEMALLKELLDIAYEDMVVIDNASPNEAAAQLAHKAEELGYIFLEADHNGGYASGNNIGLRYALEKGYRYGWVMNNDILIEDRHILDKLVNVLESAPDIAVINPDIYSPEGHMYNRDAIRPSLFDQTAGALLYKRRGRQIKDMGGYAYIYRPQGCCMLLDLAKCAQAGFMDEKTFLYFEENILAERLLKKGYHCACCIGAKVIHNASKTVRSHLQKKKLCQVKCASYRYYLEEYLHYNALKCKYCEIFFRIKCMILD